jgi:isocitrate dehydrogenase
MARRKIPITIAEGDGIGPEIMAATLQILEASGADLEILPIEVGEKVYLQGEKSGIAAVSWDTIRHSAAFLKAPISTPQGGGFKSLNVTIRTSLGLYANVRPCVSYDPFVKTKHPGMDVVIIRENEEDLYVGLEYRQTPESYHALKLMTRAGCERIIRYAFEYAVINERKKVTCFTKDNILKLSDGLFHKVFDEIAQEYPEIVNEHWIVDIGAAKLADTPTVFDVIVMPNLYGDILSDVAAQIAGSVGLAGSANIGDKIAMFEAIHGSAPRRAGQDLANPSGLLLAAVLMLVHIGRYNEAALIHNSWLRVLEEGIHTYDIYKEGSSKKLVGTKAFAEAVIARLGENPVELSQVHYATPEGDKKKHVLKESLHPTKEMVGIDVFIYSRGGLEELFERLNCVDSPSFALKMISNRGVRVWPGGLEETHCSDSWRCRYIAQTPGRVVSHKEVVDLLGLLAGAGLDFTHTEALCTFDGVGGYTLSQDEQ